MQTIDLQQGSPAWLAFRAEHFTASDAPAMMGESPYKTRSQLLHEKATGISPEVDAATQRRFDDGHRIEALARPLAEDFIGDDLYPIVGANGKYAASFDGLTMLGNINWECKTLNAALREAMVPDCTGTDLPLVYQIQMEHQAMVSECDRVLFTAAQFDAAGNPVDVRHCWYTPNPDLRARIVAGWEQFAADLANYTPESIAEPVTAQAQESLPAVFAQVSGSLAVTSNLDVFGEALKAFVERIPKDPETDQDFADTEAACKTLKTAEEKLAAAEDSALASLTNVEQMRRTVATLKDLARQTRLASEKLVKARKEAIRTEIVTTARQQFSAFLAGLQGEIRVRLQIGMPDFAGAIKGLKTLSSIKDAVSTALANAKIEANEYAADIRAKLAKFDDLVPAEYRGLFRDLDDLVTMAPPHFEAAVVARVEQQKKTDDERRQQIEDAAKAKAAEAAATPTPAAPAPAAQPMPLHGAHGEVDYTAQDQPAAITKAPADDPATLRLGQINERLAPISLSAQGLADLGITHAATDKAAKLYRESDFQRICAALIQHISEARTMETA
jgi:putative phage-type endonuclease